MKVFLAELKRQREEASLVPVTISNQCFKKNPAAVMFSPCCWSIV